MISKILIFFVAILHFYFLILEMFLWTKPLGRKIFRMGEQQAQQTAVLAANQGLYNGFLSAGLVWSLLHPEDHFAIQLATFFLVCVLAAALYGGYSVNKRIVIIQGLPALLALISILTLGL